MFLLKKHSLLAVTILVALGSGVSSQGMKRLEVDFEYVAKKAEQLSRKKFKPTNNKTPEALRDLNFDDYRKIRIVPEETFWMSEGMPFQVQFYHLGYLYNEPVAFNEFTKTHAQRIPYIPGFFDLRNLNFPKSFSSGLNYAGFKLLFPLNNDQMPYDEAISFLGASYFRALGEGMHYGISARGLAVNSGLSEPEEFPRFVEFWLEKPKGNSRQFLAYALMDSPSVTGAYQFQLTPSETTRVDVKAQLFFRKGMVSMGIAPLTSMFWHGENGPTGTNDYRPECHDSDGLLIETAKDRIWRPLDTHDQTRLSYFRAEELIGFGLFRRDRDFDHYQDLNANYHKRPSVWVEPKGDWGSGHVRLIELPANREFDDNIVAFWESDTHPQPGESRNVEYSLYWTKLAVLNKKAAPMPVSTRIGDHLAEEGIKVFVVEFGKIDDAGYWEEKPELKIEISDNAHVSFSSVEKNPYSDTWRATLNVGRNEGETRPVELRCSLNFDGEIRSETWTYQWIP